MTVHVGVHAEATATLSGWSAPTAAQADLRDHYLAVLAVHPDATCRSCWPEHLTAGAIVFDPTMTRVALVLHGKVNVWLQPGGHVEDGDERLMNTAIREAEEELGLSGLEPLLETPTSLHRHSAPCRPPGTEPAGFHLDVAFALIATAGTDLAASEESHDVGWFAVDRLPDPYPADLRTRVDHALSAAPRR